MFVFICGWIYVFVCMTVRIFEQKRVQNYPSSTTATTCFSERETPSINSYVYTNHEHLCILWLSRTKADNFPRTLHM